jgi:hypothetical protein
MPPHGGLIAHIVAQAFFTLRNFIHNFFTKKMASAKGQRIVEQTRKVKAAQILRENRKLRQFGTGQTPNSARLDG